MKRPLLLTSLIAFVLTGCGEARAPKLNGAGSTQVSSLFDEWAKDYKPAQIYYFDVGSGVGMDLFLSQDYEFVCTEIPVTDTQKQVAEKNGMKLVGFPLAFSAIVPVYHLDKVSAPLVFSGPVLADIYLGKITKWNDKAIKELNPKVELPDEPIKVVVRSDPSGTSNTFTSYLAKESEQWKKEKGASPLPKWTKSDNKDLHAVVSKFQEVAGNKGVVKAIKKETFSIGYVPLTLAKKESLKIGLMKVNEKDVEANKETIEAAIKEAIKEIPSDLLKLDLIGGKGTGGYPIVDTNWIIFSSNQKSSKSKDLLEFLNWSTHKGQESLEKSSYVPIPKSLIGPIEKILGASQVVKAK